MLNATDAQRYARAIALFDAANAEDPNTDSAKGQDTSKELCYAQSMSEMLARFAPDASEVVRLACRAQHIQRWKIPRQDYPMTPEGYQLWRTTLHKFHAERASDCMRETDYDEEMIERVKKVVSKRGLKVNPETQLMVDVVDLVFIEYYMLGFAAKKAEYSEEKGLDIIRKTWNKMSHQAHTFALSGALKLPQPLLPLIQKGVQGPEGVTLARTA